MVTKLERVKLEIPSALLLCAPEPAAPAGNMQSDVAAFIVDALDAGADCRGKLDQVRGLVEAP